MRILIWTLQHPTIEGIIFIPIILWWEIVEIIFAMLPGKFANFIWEIADDIITAITEEVASAIKRTPNFWDMKFFK